MAKVTRLSSKRDLHGRRPITIELPEFIVQALECRVAEANAVPTAPDDTVTLDELVEAELAETVTVAELALLEPHVPGITAAASKWIMSIK